MLECPACKHSISLKYLGRYTNWYFKRLINDCPHCKLKLIFIKKTLRVFNLGTFLIGIGLLMQIFGVFSIVASMSFSAGILSIIYAFWAPKLKVARESRSQLNNA